MFTAVFSKLTKKKKERKRKKKLEAVVHLYN